jgi:hypothetical protein
LLSPDVLHHSAPRPKLIESSAFHRPSAIDSPSRVLSFFVRARRWGAPRCRR